MAEDHKRNRDRRSRADDRRGNRLRNYERRNDNVHLMTVSNGKHRQGPTLGPVAPSRLAAFANGRVDLLGPRKVKRN